jgi:mono/diheme cytochrome c family protein
MNRRVLAVVATAAFIVVALAGGAAQTASLVLRFGDQTRTYSTGDLLARRDATTITIPLDVSYRRAMEYRAIPLDRLLSGLAYERFEAAQVSANDGFIAEIPTSLLIAKAGATAFIAIDDPRKPWPNLPGSSASGGPYYLVWEHPERSGIMSEQWVTNVGAITGVESPARRWPQLGVATSASGSVERGMKAYITQCLPCHKLDGAGSSTLGPDLGRPMNATVYMTDKGLRALIRDPKSVRSWPQMKMNGFSSSLLSDAALDAIVDYLKYKAAHHFRKSSEPTS